MENNYQTPAVPTGGNSGTNSGNVFFGSPVGDSPINSGTGMPALAQPDARHTKWKWLLLVGLGVILVILVVVLILRFVGGPNYGESYKLAHEFYEQLYEVMGGRSSACYSMIHDQSDATIGESAYREYVATCKEDISGVRDLAEKLGKTSGVNRDSALKKKYEVVANDVDKVFPKKQDLDKMEKVFVAVHDFSVKLGDIDSGSSENEVKEAAKILVNSGSKDWAEFGKVWESKMLQYIQAYQNYDKANYSDANYDDLRRAYSDAYDAVRTYLSDFDSSEWDNGGLNISLMDDLDEAAYELKEAARELYEQNYDGKNEEDCTDFGDGEASCR